MTVRESPDELTIRAKEVGTWKTYINVDHIEKERWVLTLVDYDWYAFCQALYKGIQGEDWEICMRPTKTHEQGCGGVKKPQEAQKAKALWKMKAAKDAGEEYHDPTFEENIVGRNQTRLALWEKHLKDPYVALDKVLKCVENSCWEVLARVLCAGSVLPRVVLASSKVLWEKPIWEGVWPNLDPMDTVCLRTASMEWNVPGKYGPHGELFFFQIEKEPASMPGSETSSPFINDDIRLPPFLR